MVKWSYSVLVVIVLIVLGSTYYINKTTVTNAEHRMAVYAAISAIKNDYYLLKLALAQNQTKEAIQTRIDALQKSTNGFLAVNSTVVDANVIKQETDALTASASANLSIDSNLVEILNTIEFNYNIEQDQTRKNVFSFQKLIVGLFVLLVGYLIYFIYHGDKEKTKLFRLQKSLEKSLVTDSLTGLGNRIAITKFFRKKIEPLTVVLFNIARFKHINDFYGIHVGDAVLEKFAKELKKFTTKCNGVRLYRIGGDDFAVVVQTKDVQNVKMMAANTIKFFQNNGIVYKDTLIDISLVSGITQTKPYLETADLALKEAKRDKNSSIVLYDERLDKSHIVEKNINAVKMLKEGIANDMFFPEFQPIFDIKTGAVTKYEALIRLEKEDGTIVYPASFIDEAKESKLLNKLTKIMLIKSFEIFRHHDCSFSINLSFSELLDEKNQDEIIKILDDYGRHAKKLTFEILEDDAIEDYELLNRFLNKVQKFGVDIAIDDFGSGYSNFGHIISMNTHFLKIDGSLIKIVDYDVQARVLVKSIVDFAKSMQIKTVAEFVHSKDVYDTVERLGVDSVQGFYLGKPKASLLDIPC
jgi:diguanylate cyclase (GGDEF)-like protein